MFRQIAQAPHGVNQEGPPPPENDAPEQRRHRQPASQDELDRQLGRKLYMCQKLVIELQSVECCLLWFRDKLPAALLLKNAPGLLGLPQQPIDRPNDPSRPAPSPPATADLHDAKEYLRAANTRERFMRMWREQAYPAQNIYVPRKVARAKGSLSIPQDPWQSFPDGENWLVRSQFGSRMVSSGYEPCWSGNYAVNDWQRVVAYLEGTTDHLERAIGACFR